MNVFPRIAFTLLLAAAPLALFGLTASDDRIEEAATRSYNLHTVLDGRVQARVLDGQVTLTGSVTDRDARDLAEDTVRNLPGVTGVTNDIAIVPLYTEGSDSWMAAKIRVRLLVKANISALSTYVSVQDGIVTLGGTAASPAQKELTGRYAGEIDSVKSVTNNIVVKAGPAPGGQIDDASITTQVKYALLRQQATRPLPTGITTTDGVVRLTGTAANAAEKSLVSRLVLDVRGTTSVINELVVTN